jgi:hypothetical protein
VRPAPSSRGGQTSNKPKPQRPFGFCANSVRSVLPTGHWAMTCAHRRPIESADSHSALRRHMTMARDLTGAVPKTVTWSCGLLLSRLLSIQQLAAKGVWDAALRAIANQCEPDPFGPDKVQMSSGGLLTGKSSANVDVQMPGHHGEQRVGYRTVRARSPLPGLREIRRTPSVNCIAHLAEHLGAFRLSSTSRAARGAGFARQRPPAAA